MEQSEYTTLSRLVLRCRADARKRFASLRSDVLVKLELLDNKHVQDIVHQLKRLMANLTSFHNDCHKLLNGAQLFPIEVDLTRSAFQYESTNQVVQDEEEEEAVEAKPDEDDDKLLCDCDNSSGLFTNVGTSNSELLASGSHSRGAEEIETSNLLSGLTLNNQNYSDNNQQCSNLLD